MGFKVIQLDLTEQLWAATYKLGVGKFPSLVPIEGRDLNGRKDVDKHGEAKATNSLA